ncbi:TfoX/Sxy family protein [Saccharicrinis sp. GN24d3]|uniref:TfoX/Sxy family protein n=1 Tax=Saccharicrinis sp. GN24d3 TaxID=3458416 RepID=UPI00403576A4
MAVSNDFLQYVLDQLSSGGNVHVNRMFGGAALYQEDLAFALIANDIFYLKVDNTNKEKYIVAGSTQLKPFKNNSTVLSFYNIPGDVLENSDKFVEWEKESLDIQKKRNRQ